MRTLVLSPSLAAFAEGLRVAAVQGFVLTASDTFGFGLPAVPPRPAGQEGGAFHDACMRRYRAMKAYNDAQVAAQAAAEPAWMTGGMSTP